jgi:TRAP-type C4-dicarboxylate transport system permease small subunit
MEMKSAEFYEQTEVSATWYEKTVQKVCGVFACISGSAVVAMMLIVVINAIKRTFSTPISGTTEIVGWLAAISISFALGYTQLHRGHVDIDLLFQRFPPMLQKVLRVACMAASLVFFTIVAWQLIQYGLTLAANKNVSQTLAIVFYPFVFAVSAGFMSFVLVLVNDLAVELKGGK